MGEGQDGGGKVNRRSPPTPTLPHKGGREWNAFRQHSGVDTDRLRTSALSCVKGRARSPLELPGQVGGFVHHVAQDVQPLLPERRVGNVGSHARQQHLGGRAGTRFEQSSDSAAQTPLPSSWYMRYSDSTRSSPNT